MDELKACPFCGGKAKIVEVTDEDGDTFDAVECQTCFVRTAGHIVKRLAVANWNRRFGNG